MKYIFNEISKEQNIERKELYLEIMHESLNEQIKNPNYEYPYFQNHYQFYRNPNLEKKIF